jgi:hypothetical protein
VYETVSLHLHERAANSFLRAQAIVDTVAAGKMAAVAASAAAVAGGGFAVEGAVTSSGERPAALLRGGQPLASAPVAQGAKQRSRPRAHAHHAARPKAKSRPHARASSRPASSPPARATTTVSARAGVASSSGSSKPSGGGASAGSGGAASEFGFEP